MVKDHYAGLGFTRTGQEGEETFWSLAVDDSVGPLPHAIREGVLRLSPAGAGEAADPDRVRTAA
ncbi:MAG TPA: hypothetical protein VH092_19480, partial [Urbifossiella sp.]|nr:hypothetical protein [Urbifossiella sp.]